MQRETVDPNWRKWKKNKEGVCAICNKKLGFYATKFVHKESGDIVCAFSDHGVNHSSAEYWYYTDG